MVMDKLRNNCSHEIFSTLPNYHYSCMQQCFQLKQDLHYTVVQTCHLRSPAANLTDVHLSRWHISIYVSFKWLWQCNCLYLSNLSFSALHCIAWTYLFSDRHAVGASAVSWCSASMNQENFQKERSTYSASCNLISSWRCTKLCTL